MRFLARWTPLLAALALLAMACGEHDWAEGSSSCNNDHAKIEGWRDAERPRLAAGASLRLSVSTFVEPEATSSDDAVATASLDGAAALRVVGRSPGVARITVRSACGPIDTFDVEVVAVDRFDLRVVLEDIASLPRDVPTDVPPELAPAGVTLLPDAMLFLQALPVDVDGRPLHGKLDPGWTSSDPGVVAVPFGPPGDGRATVSWYEGHAPVTVSAGQSTLVVGFARQAQATALAVIDAVGRAAVTRLRIEPTVDEPYGALVVVFAYDADGRLLLGTSPTPSGAGSRDEDTVVVAGPYVGENSGVAGYALAGGIAGTTKIDFWAHGASAVLDVEVP